MQQQFKTEEAERHGYTPEEYTNVVRRAQMIRAEKEGRLSREVLEASAAEVGIREEDLREAERQLAEEKRQQEALRQQRAARQKNMRTAGAVAGGVLALLTMFGYNGLNSQRLAVQQARSNLQSTLQRRADTLPQLANLTREGAAREREFLDLVNKAQQGLRSGDLNQQLEGNEALKQAMEMAGSNPRFRSSALYQDLMSEVAGAENRINVARQRYNDAATRYNGTAQSFPNNLVRPLFGFPGEMPLFQPKGNVDVPPSL